MEFNDRNINQHYSSYSYIPPIYNYFTQPPQPAYFMGPHMGQIDLYHPYHLHHHHHPHPLLRHPLPSPNIPHDMHVSILREIEKEEIREEMIMYEISRHRMLEAEVRRDLMMMEKDLVPQGSVDGFPFRPSPPNPVEIVSPKRLLLLGARDEKVTRQENGGFETLPIKKAIADLRISEVKAVSEEANEKQKVDKLGKLDENISRSKRKLVTSTVADASEPPSSGIPKKRKHEEEWKCAICQVNCTNERVLNNHLQGKKHKAKVAASMTGKKYSIGLFPNTTTKTVDASKVKFSAEPLMEEAGKDSKKDSTKNDKSVSAQKVQNIGEVMKNTKHLFWCEVCKVGPMCLKVMTDHEKGKKHVNRLRRSDQKANGNVDEAARKNCSIGLFPDNFTKTVDASKVKFTAEPLLKEARKDSQKDCTRNDKSVSAQKVQKTGDVKKNTKYLFWCEMCKVGAMCMKVMCDHEKGKKHVNRLRRSDQKANGNVDETTNEARSADEKFVVNSVEPEKNELVDAAKCENDKVVKGNKEGDIMTSATWPWIKQHSTL